MAILYSKQLYIGVSAAPVQQLLFDTNDTQATVLTTGYLSKNCVDSGIKFTNKQIAFVYTTDKGMGTYKIVVADGVASFEQGDDNPTAVNIYGAPVVSGNMAAFYGTDGTIQDLGFKPSNSNWHNIAMVFGTATVGNFSTFNDVNGTIRDLGFSPTNASKTKVVMANASVVVGRVASFADTAGTVQDAGFDANLVLTASITTPDINANIIRFDITVPVASLASGGSVTLYTSSGSKQYKISSLFVNGGGTNFSGDGGDRLLSITDNTTVYSVVPAASLQTLANTGWGVTGLPFPASAAINTSTAAGASLVAKYSGGTTDYTAGSVVISGILQRVA